MIVLPSLIFTVLPASEVTVNGTSFPWNVTLSRSELPVSFAAGRSIVGRCGAVASIVIGSTPLSGLMLPARSSCSAVMS